VKASASAKTVETPFSSEYAGSSFAFTGGEIKKVVFDIADDVYIDVEGHLAAAMARD
jgi:arylsulfatase